MARSHLSGSMEFTIQRNKNTRFLRDSLSDVAQKKVDWLLLEGSSRSGKTWGILFFLISLALDPSSLGKKKVIIRGFRQNATTTRGTIVADFLDIMQNEISYEQGDKKFSLFDSVGSWNKTTQTYTFNNGSVIEFSGSDNPQKLQGAKQDIAWLNECMEITPDAKAQIEMRTTTLKIADWNPSLTAHWVFNILAKNDGSARYCHSTYKDNKNDDTGESNLTASIIRTIESYDPSKPENVQAGTADAFKWAVYGEGRRGAREGQVFPRIHWDIIDDKLFPDKSVCQRHGYGGDFGFSQDPTAFIDCRFHNNALYVREMVYERGLLIGDNLEDNSIPSLQQRLKWYEQFEQEHYQFNRLSQQIWDCADPRSIQFLRTIGFNASPCVKGKDSISYGISLMKSYRIYICRSSQNIQREFENYCYKKNPDGTFSDVPEDANNHAIDAIRYWTMHALKPTNVIGQVQRPMRRSRNNFYDTW